MPKSFQATNIEIAAYNEYRAKTPNSLWNLESFSRELRRSTRDLKKSCVSYADVATKARLFVDKLELCTEHDIEIDNMSDGLTGLRERDAITFEQSTDNDAEYDLRLVDVYEWSSDEDDMVYVDTVHPNNNHLDEEPVFYVCPEKSLRAIEAFDRQLAKRRAAHRGHKQQQPTFELIKGKANSPKQVTTTEPSSNARPRLNLLRKGPRQPLPMIALPEVVVEQPVAAVVEPEIVKIEVQIEAEPVVEVEVIVKQDETEAEPKPVTKPEPFIVSFGKMTKAEQVRQTAKQIELISGLSFGPVLPTTSKDLMAALKRLSGGSSDWRQTISQRSQAAVVFVN